MKRLKKYWVYFVLVGIVACSSGRSEETSEEEQSATFVSLIEEAHHKDAWYAEGMVQFDLELIFGGKQRFYGTIQMTPDGGRVRMEDTSGVSMIFDGKDAFISPDTLSLKKARFDLLTWSYFFAAPFKLSDPGTNVEELGMKPLGENSFDAARLTFGDGVGDSPDDWYILYQDTTTNYLVGMAYIVTYSKSKEEAEEDPHLITYESFEKVGPYPIATNWNFWTWNEKGEMDKLLGTATISNVKFKPLDEDLFVIPRES